MARSTTASASARPYRWLARATALRAASMNCWRKRSRSGAASEGWSWPRSAVLEAPPLAEPLDHLSGHRLLGLELRLDPRGSPCRRTRGVHDRTPAKREKAGNTRLAGDYHRGHD